MRTFLPHHRQPTSSRAFAAAGLSIFIFLMIGAGCASYSAPGKSADFRAMGITAEQASALTDRDIAHRLDRKPLAGFPASVAVVRVQAPGYRSRTSEGYGTGKYSIVTTRDVETDDAFNKLTTLPMIDCVAMLNRLVVNEHLRDERDLRNAAAQVQADMLLIYTFDTQFTTEKKAAPLGVITLGLFPDRQARVNSTASAVLVDTRNGYVYGLAEGSGHDNQITNAWLNASTVDAARRKAEQDAFNGLVGQIETMWKGVVNRYGPTQTAGSG
jgi:hypothetical protein